MSEVVCDVKTIMVQRKCDNCNDGLMKHTGEYQGIYALHECDYCGYMQAYKTVYPLTRIVPIEPLRYPREDEMI